MPFVPASEALNLPVAHVVEMIRHNGPGTWRRPIVGSRLCRAVLLQLPPGNEPHHPHRHPRAAEVFIVLVGHAAFSIGDEPEFVAGPLDVAYAPANVRHGIRAPGPETLVLVSVVAPNLDEPDEAIEEAP